MESMRLSGLMRPYGLMRLESDETVRSDMATKVGASQAKNWPVAGSHFYETVKSHESRASYPRCSLQAEGQCTVEPFDNNVLI